MRVYVAMGWAGGGWEVSGTEGGGLVYRRLGHDGNVLAEKELSPSPEAWRGFRERLAELGVHRWEARYEPEYPVCGGTAWAVRLEDEEGRLESTGEDAYPPNWEGFLRALGELAGRELG